MKLFGLDPRVHLRHDGVFWRRLAALGAQHFPEWWVRYSPPVFGLAAAAFVPAARRTVVSNLHKLRGRKGRLADAIDTGKTFATYAGCLAEVLANGSKNARPLEVSTVGRPNLEAAAREGNGVILVTIHSAGWEVVGPLFAQHCNLELVLVMEPERDAAARAIHDQARRAVGLSVVHIGDDPLAALPLLRHLKKGGGVALQADRWPHGVRTRPVTLFGEPGELPEGPLRLAQLSGAPIVPVFNAREGYRRYAIEALPALRVSRRASESELDEKAQFLADAITAFLRRHPTQWFQFGADRLR